MHTYRRNPAQNLQLVTGQRAYSRLINGVQSHFVDLRIRADLTIGTADATAVRNGGSVLALFDEIGIDENGVVRHLYDGRDLSFLTQVFSTQRTTRVVAAVGQATYNLQEVVRIIFADPFSMVPRETAFREHNINLLLQVFAKYNADATRLVKPAGTTVLTLANVSVEVVQHFDQFQTQKPYFIPSVTQQVHPVVGTNPHDVEYLRTPLPLRGILIAQDAATVGAVSDIINSVAIKGDNGDIYGPNQIPWATLVREQEMTMLGSVLGDSSRAFIRFTEHGGLSNALNPTQFINLRADMDVQLTAVAGAGASLVRFTMLHLEPDAQLCDTPPFPV